MRENTNGHLKNLLDSFYAALRIELDALQQTMCVSTDSPEYDIWLKLVAETKKCKKEYFLELKKQKLAELLKAEEEFNVEALTEEFLDAARKKSECMYSLLEASHKVEQQLEEIFLRFPSKLL